MRKLILIAAIVLLAPCGVASAQTHRADPYRAN